MGVVFCVLVACSPAAACVARGFAGEQTLAPWDHRDSLARQIEADGAALGLPATQISRLAWALRLGAAASDALTAADLTALRAFDQACTDAQEDAGSAQNPSYGFDLSLGWPQLAASGAFSALAISGLVIAARLHTIRRRRRKRYFCSIAVQLRDEKDEAHPGRVEDLSMTGARLSLRGVAGLTVGAPIVLDFGGTPIRGQVAWKNRHFTGVDFDRMLTRAELLRLVRPEKYAPLQTQPP